MKLKKKTKILRRCHFLEGAQEEVLSALAEDTEVLKLPAGERVVTKGEPGSRMFFIADGKVRVHDEDVVLAYLDAGEVFGEMAVLDSDVRSASVTSETDTRLLSLERNALWRTVSQSPDALKSIIASVLQRERAIVREVTARTQQVLAFEKELEIGRQIQANFLPESIPELPDWEIATYFEAAREVAGDFYDVFELEPGKYLALVIGDVCDKGVGAALFMTLFRSLIRASCQFGLTSRETAVREGSVEHMADLLASSIATTNSYIATTHGRSSMFASVFFGVLDQENGRLYYINGGHESPVIFRDRGEHEILEVTGGVLGLFPFARYGVATARLEAGDLLFAYTDGVNEAKDEGGGQFGDERILAMVDGGWGDGSEFLEQMLARIQAFRGEAEQSDDITMFAVKNRTAVPQ